MAGETGTGTVAPLLGPGLWIQRGPARLVARPAGWMVLVPSTPAPLVEAAWELLADPPAATEIPAALADLHPQHPLSDLVVALRTGQAEIDLALLGTAPLAVHDEDGARLLQGEEQAVRGWRLAGVRRLSFGALPAERSLGAPRLESGSLGVRGLVHCLQDPAELDDGQRQALAAEVAAFGRAIADPAEAQSRRTPPLGDPAGHAATAHRAPRDPARHRPEVDAEASPGPLGPAGPAAAAPDRGEHSGTRPPGRTGATGLSGSAAPARSPQAAAAIGEALAPPASQGPSAADGEPGRVQRLFTAEFAPLRRLRGSLAAPAAEASRLQTGAEPPAPETDPLAPPARPGRPVTEGPVSEGASRAYDELFGATLARRVEDAAVRAQPDPMPPGPAAAEEARPAADLSASAPTGADPSASEPAPDPDPEPVSGGPGVWERPGPAAEVPGLIDRVPGVDRALREESPERLQPARWHLPGADAADPADAPAASRSALRSAGSDPAVTDPRDSVRIPARICPLGHAEDPARSRCRRCATPLEEEIALRERPPLGRLETTEVVAGASVEVLLDREAVIGRRPRGEGRNRSGQGPRLVTVDSPGQGLSRSHLAVRLRGWQVRVQDLGTVNGTVLHRPGQAPRPVRGREEITLEDGDRLVLGDELPLSYREVP